MKVRNYLLLPICLYVECLIKNCKLKKLFFTLVLPNRNFWILVCVNMCVFQISLIMLHHRHLQWFVLQQTVSYRVIYSCVVCLYAKFLCLRWYLHGRWLESYIQRRIFGSKFICFFFPFSFPFIFLLMFWFWFF